ncbi:ferredoxin [Leptospira terpstrae]|uniref:4Fe-4S single cluster domain protein n=1 Tax=Leptospira terpstrae serovar Hualin str. LT 11-33 = ATCC 700639 TaxID=1257025 RepID=N1VW25_9LEPT|nr:ferredoxin [Leptospira terpstrae]EMY62728.1 4Fe-4S single cluster domain protein [Leptospira terpstrae serovar Hualin str. LT 11-33 = ATCC 700639]
MADKSIKQPENVPGKYYVDQTCVPCNDCIKEAPNLLQYSADESHIFVKKQPTNQNEEKQAKAAMAMCPVDAIGDDGE